MIKDDIIKMLPKLSSADRQIVATALKALESFDGFAGENDLISDWLMSGLVSVLVREGVLSGKGSYFDMKRRKAYKTYLSKLPETTSFLTRLMEKQDLNTRQRPQMGFLCAKALAVHLRELGIFTVSTMMSQIDRIPEALNQAYPGYAAAGLFHFVIQNISSQYVDRDGGDHGKTVAASRLPATSSPRSVRG